MMRTVHHRLRLPRGLSLVYMTAFLTALFAVVSLAVDFGRVQLAKTELQRTADASARYAATGLFDNTYRARAQQVASENQVDGNRLALEAEDVLVGNWDPSRTPKFDPNRGPVNAIEVTARLSAERGTAIPLLFARVLGVATCDASASAVVFVDSDRVGIVGLDWIEIKGGARIDSFNPTIGPYNLSKAANASVSSNGDIKLANNSVIEGDAHPGVGRAVIGGTVTGSTGALGAPLVMPPVSSGNAATDNDNSNIPNKFLSNGNDFKMGAKDRLTLPGGTYYFDDFTMAGGAQLTLTGPVVMYIAGSMTLGGHVSTAQNAAKNFQIKMVGAGQAEIGMTGGSALYVSLYGPQSPLTLNGGGNLYGSLIGKSILITGQAGIHDDTSLITTSPRVVTVR